eukprot:s750_g27.t1
MSGFGLTVLICISILNCGKVDKHYQAAKAEAAIGSKGRFVETPKRVFATVSQANLDTYSQTPVSSFSRAHLQPAGGTLFLQSSHGRCFQNFQLMEMHLLQVFGEGAYRTLSKVLVSLGASLRPQFCPRGVTEDFPDQEQTKIASQEVRQYAEEQESEPARPRIIFFSKFAQFPTRESANTGHYRCSYQPITLCEYELFRGSIIFRHTMGDARFSNSGSGEGRDDRLDQTIVSRSYDHATRDQGSSGQARGHFWSQDISRSAQRNHQIRSCSRSNRRLAEVQRWPPKSMDQTFGGGYRGLEVTDDCISEATEGVQSSDRESSERSGHCGCCNRSFAVATVAVKPPTSAPDPGISADAQSHLDKQEMIQRQKIEELLAECAACIKVEDDGPVDLLTDDEMDDARIRKRARSADPPPAESGDAFSGSLK